MKVVEMETVYINRLFSILEMQTVGNTANAQISI